jgi:hypothetical protein
MKSLFRLLPFVWVVFTACKSNQDAYNKTYQKLKEKEDAQVEAKAQTTMSVRMDTLVQDTLKYRIEPFTLLLGKEQHLSTYSLVAKTFLNRTNAKGYYGRMIEDGYPALLIQNGDQLYRILVASFPTEEQALAKKEELRPVFPEVFVLARKE